MGEADAFERKESVRVGKRLLEGVGGIGVLGSSSPEGDGSTLDLSEGGGSSRGARPSASAPTSSASWASSTCPFGSRCGAGALSTPSDSAGGLNCGAASSCSLSIVAIERGSSGPLGGHRQICCPGSEVHSTTPEELWRCYAFNCFRLSFSWQDHDFDHSVCNAGWQTQTAIRAGLACLGFRGQRRGRILYRISPQACLCLHLCWLQESIHQAFSTRGARAMSYWRGFIGN